MIKVFFLISLLLMLSSFFCILYLKCATKKNDLVLEKMRKKDPNFCILIPARDESAVIEELLKSIQKQTRPIPMEHVYVIVEEKKDSTVAICAKYHVRVIFRKHCEKQSKGYALEEAIFALKQEKKEFDAYFIFDADNVLDYHFLEEMEKDYQKGYAISCGYRNIKNGNENVLAAASGLIYFILNEWINKQNNKKKKNIMISGTGFYIHGRLIKEWGGYPFHSLTEDMELNYYATLHNLSTHYNENAIFYDEQPLTFRQSVIQRRRWVRGYFQNWFQNISKLHQKEKENPSNIGSVRSMKYGIFPLILFVLGFLFFLFTCLLFIIKERNFLYAPFYLFFLIIFLLLCYLILVIGTNLLLIQQKKKIKLNYQTKAKVIWYHPFFLLTYIYVIILILFEKDKGWERVEHGKAS